MVLTPTQINSNERLASLTPVYLPQQDQVFREKTRCFPISHTRRSENALLLFNDHYVFKQLQPYQDQRYSLKEISDRHACLLEGWRWNRFFTHGIHLGLARLYKSVQKEGKISHVVLGKFIDPDWEPLVKDAEYVLAMRSLPQKYRLDRLLEGGNSFSHQYYEQVLIQFLWNIHTDPSFPVIPVNSVEGWGNITQIERKLRYNITIVEKPGDDVRRKSALRQTEEYKDLLSISKSLKNALLPIFSQETYQRYFQQRREKRQIKRCHGDLKARNIWIFPSADNDKNSLWEGVYALDAIDFNREFCIIDTLSDFAMLVADIRVRTDQQNLADRMVELYLRRTNQLAQSDRFVLAYYLVEKSFIGACVNIMYDNRLDLGSEYLKATRSYLVELKRLMHNEKH